MPKSQLGEMGKGPREVPKVRQDEKTKRCLHVKARQQTYAGFQHPCPQEIAETCAAGYGSQRAGVLCIPHSSIRPKNVVRGTASRTPGRLGTCNQDQLLRTQNTSAWGAKGAGEQPVIGAGSIQQNMSSRMTRVFIKASSCKQLPFAHGNQADPAAADPAEPSCLTYLLSCCSSPANSGNSDVPVAASTHDIFAVLT